MFPKTFVINLPFKSDRLGRFMASVPQCLGNVEIWRAVHGDTVQHPDWWTAGRGAWGCYRSHLQILEHCYNCDIESYIVFEDDAIFRPNFATNLATFLENVPPDWQQIYLGGQLLHEVAHPPLSVNAQVLIPFNVNRTHCYAVHRRGYDRLYRHLNRVPFANGEHVDHHLGRLHESGDLRLYVPSKWLVGQDGGPSNISGNTNASTFFTDPEKLVGERRAGPRYVPAVFLEAPHEVAWELERRGWHRGHWQNEQRLDRGVCNAIASKDLRGGLTQWYKSVQPEAVREGRICVCLHHSSLTWPVVNSLKCATFFRIVATTADEAEAKLSVAIQMKERPDIDPDAPKSAQTQATKRNLIYHIWPRRGNGVWQWNVAELVKRIGQFDGVRSIGVVIDAASDTMADVQAAFGNVRIDNWMEFQNDPAKGESATYAKLLETIPPDDSFTFRGHAKGVRYDDPNATREWTAMLYEICLDDPSFVAASLAQYPCCGPFVVESDWPRPGRWHFSGAFYWFRSNVLANPATKVVEQNYWGAELWPQTIWERCDAGVLFGQTCARLYDAHELERMKGWLEDWRRKKA